MLQSKSLNLLVNIEKTIRWTIQLDSKPVIGICKIVR